MRILMFANTAMTGPSGVRGVIKNLAKEMRELGHKVHYILREDLTPLIIARSHRNLFSIIEVPIALVRKIVTLKKKLGNFDIVDISGGEGYLFGLLKGLLGTESKYIFRNQALMLRVYGHYENNGRTLLNPVTKIPLKLKLWQPYLLQKQEKIALLKSHKVIAMCKEDFLFLTKIMRIDPSRVVVVPLGVSERFFLGSNRNKSNSKGELLFIGGYTTDGFWGQYEGIGCLVDAFSLVVRRFPKVRLTIIGCSDVEQVIQCFHRDTRANVTVYPFIPHEELVREYLKYKILIHPSLFEGFGRIFLEGMAAGLAVIATRVGGAADICENRKDSILIPPGDSESLTKAIVHLLENEDIRRQIGLRAREKARNYTWGKTAIRTLRVYEDVLAGG